MADYPQFEIGDCSVDNNYYLFSMYFRLLKLAKQAKCIDFNFILFLLSLCYLLFLFS